MKKSFYLGAALLVLIAGCADNSYKKSTDGSEYRIISNENGKKAVAGNFIQLNILAKYKDSVLFSTAENGMPRFIPFDTAQLPPFFKNINEGDSLVLRMSTDSLMKMGQSAPYMKKGEFIYQYFKVTKVFNNKEEVEKVAKTFEAGAKAKNYQKSIQMITKELADNPNQVKADDKAITDYLAKNHITASKTAWGTYVSIDVPGTGDNLNDSSIAAVNYTGKTLKDTVFDSNTDQKFGHPEPYDVDMSEFSVIPGWIDGLKQMKKGSKGRLIVPSILGYGQRGSGKIAPNECLVFDIDVTDVLNREQFEAKQLEKRSEMMKQQQMQQQMQEQMQKQLQKGNPGAQQVPTPPVKK